MLTVVIILTPFITALIGWLTNWIAIQMLFYPRQPKKILFLTWQGLIPRRHKQLAVEAAEVIEREILQQHLIVNKIREVDLDAHLSTTAHTLVWQRIAPRLKAVPLLGSFVSDRMLTTLEEIAAEEIRREARPLLERVALQFEKDFHIRDAMEENINNFNLDHLEEVILGVARREFRTIERMGAVVGFVVGLAQLLILWLSGAF